MLNRNTNVRINYIFNTAYQILTVFTPIITAPYISRTLKAEGVGLYSYTYSIVTYFVLFATFGSTTYGQREIAYYRQDITKRSKIFWNVFFLRITLSVLMFTFYVLCIPFISNDQNRELLFIQSLYILNVALDVSWYFQGREEFVIITIRNTLSKIASIISIFVFVKCENDVNLYGLIVIFGTTAGLICTLPMLKREVCRTFLEELHILKSLKECIPFFIPTIAIQMYTVLDKTMIGVYTTSNAENGYYDQAEKIVKMTLVLITSLSTVIAPKIATAYKKNEMEIVKSSFKLLIRYVLLVGSPIMFGLFSISPYFIPSFLGPGYEKCIILMRIFSPLVILIGLSNAIGNGYLIQTNNQNVVNLSVFFGAICNVILNFILIPQYISIGAACASIIAEGMVTFIQILWIRKDYRLKDIFFKNSIYIFAGLIMALLVSFEGRLLFELEISNVIIIIVQILSGTIVYVSILLYKKDDMIQLCKKYYLIKRWKR